MPVLNMIADVALTSTDMPTWQKVSPRREHERQEGDLSVLLEVLEAG
jgi:hypothetical protein